MAESGLGRVHRPSTSPAVPNAGLPLRPFERKSPPSGPSPRPRPLALHPAKGSGTAAAGVQKEETGNTAGLGKPHGTPTSDSSFEDEIILVASSSSSVPRTKPTLPPTGAPSASKPGNGSSSSASRLRRWTLEIPSSRLSETARGKRPAEGENAPSASKRQARAAVIGPASVVRSVYGKAAANAEPTRPTSSRRRAFDGVEVPLRRPTATRQHTRWDSQEEETVTNSPFGSPQSAHPSPTLSSQSNRSPRSSHSFELVLESRRESPTSGPFSSYLQKRSPLSTSPQTAGKQLPSPSASLIPAKPAASSVSAPLNFPSRPRTHPLNQLRIRQPPPAALPLSPLPSARMLNPDFEPAQQFGWVAGTYPKRRAEPRSRALVHIVVPPILPESILSPALDSAASSSQRRSGRVPRQAQLPCAIYPSATDRLALLDSSTSSSTSSSRSSSPSLVDAPRPLASAPPKPKKPLTALMHARQRWSSLSERHRGPYRIDGLALGTVPDVLSYEWDEDELRIEARRAGRGWTSAAWRAVESEVRLVRGLGEAAELCLRARAGDEEAREEVGRGIELQPWRWRSMQEGRGCVGNEATGWATREWREYLDDDSMVDQDDSDDVVRTYVLPHNVDGAAGHDGNENEQERVLLASSPRRKSGASLMDVPPATSSIHGGDEEDADDEASDGHDADVAPDLDALVQFEDEEMGVVEADLLALAQPDDAELALEAAPTREATSTRQAVLRGSSSSASPSSSDGSSRTRQASGANRSTAPTSVSTPPPPVPASPAADKGKQRSDADADEPAVPKVKPTPKRISPAFARHTLRASSPLRPFSQLDLASSDETSDASYGTAASPVSPTHSEGAASSSTAAGSSSAKSAASPGTPRTAAPRKRAAAPVQEDLPKGMVRCPYPSCPLPVFKPKSASTATTHALNYHHAEVTLTFQRPFRTARLQRDAQQAFTCPFCGFWSMNASSTKQHVYTRTSRVCPGPPVVG
ncbi:hypothetical protein Rhopal_000617-T1 [Rhodotorula paludigena]|uniref:Uncharacterized protein n=1 Tax=Rhodotorula paludigena TaxID=86838 RepID=A0AAV5GEA0_9BASI|nr:hypothetical protein Rhopal_000617-T1 [Rhodotorula paludigena]